MVRILALFFTGESADIMGLFTGALERLGIEWRRSNRNNISIARRSPPCGWRSSWDRSTDRSSPRDE
jgi:hypothetical protein